MTYTMPVKEKKCEFFYCQSQNAEIMDYVPSTTFEI